MELPPLEISDLGQKPYSQVWQQMRHYTQHRDADSADQLWLVEHPAVYTLGQAGKKEHLLQSTDIPLVQSDRGGQITYHGPGQIVLYTLFDLRRLGIGVRNFVITLENAVIGVLADHGVEARSRRDAPGVYVGDAKIAALGLRVRKGCSYHGLSLNVDMDLTPFAWINPCGYSGLEVTSTRVLGVDADFHELAEQLINKLQHGLRQFQEQRQSTGTTE